MAELPSRGLALAAGQADVCVHVRATQMRKKGNRWQTHHCSSNFEFEPLPSTRTSTCATAPSWSASPARNGFESSPRAPPIDEAQKMNKYKDIYDYECGRSASALDHVRPRQQDRDLLDVQ